MKLTEKHKNNISKGLLDYFTKHEKKAIDLTGQKFGRLTVIRRNYPNGKNGANWLCKCECGKEKVVNGANLRRGNTKSCGCLQKNYRGFKPKIASMRYVIHEYKKSAKERGYEYKLTEEQFAEITKKDCYYCGAKPSRPSNYQNNNGVYIYNGIDRIDNTKGYTIDNVVPCCTRCNYAKKNFGLQDYKDWIKKSYIKMFDKIDAL